MWGQLRDTSTPGKRSDDSAEGGGHQVQQKPPAAALPRRSRPSPMNTPAPAEAGSGRPPEDAGQDADGEEKDDHQLEQQTPAARAERYADYLVTPGKSPTILTAPTFGDDADDTTHDGNDEDELLVSPERPHAALLNTGHNAETIVVDDADLDAKNDADATVDSAARIALLHETKIPSSAAQHGPRGPLSPFSPDARKVRAAIRRQKHEEPSSETKKWTLKPCRKVSVLVRVMPPGGTWERARDGLLQKSSSRKRDRSDNDSGDGVNNDSDSMQLGVFPLLPAGATTTPANADDAPATRLLSLASMISSSDSSGASLAANSLVVINPSAFGTRIPSALTMETARVVAEVGHIDSEDWARKFRFEEVMWPDVGNNTSRTVGAGRCDGTLIALAKAMVSDALGMTETGHTCADSFCGASESGLSGLCNTSVLCTLGSGRSYTAFGRASIGQNAGEKRPDAEDLALDCASRAEILDRAGFLGMLITELLDSSLSSRSPTPLDFCVSMIEVVDEDVLRDMFRLKGIEFDPGKPRIRHPDHHGAVVQNLTELRFKSFKEVEAAMRKAFLSTANRGHVVATIKIFESSVQNGDGEQSGSLIQVVDLNSGDHIEGDFEFDSAFSGEKRRSASIRKSLSGLRGILRGLIVREAQRSTTQTLSYRECTLTKLLQRSLEALDSRAVLVACVDPKKDAYHKTIPTLNYVNRLWIKPGLTAQSPFQDRLKGSATARKLFGEGNDNVNVTENCSKVDSPSGAKALLSKLKSSTDSALLKSTVSDPRQRVATLIASSSPPETDRKTESRVFEPTGPVVAARVVSKSSIPKRSGKSDTFDSILAKLDALESSPTYEARDSTRDDSFVTSTLDDPASLKSPLVDSPKSSLAKNSFVMSKERIVDSNTSRSNTVLQEKVEELQRDSIERSQRRDKEIKASSTVLKEQEQLVIAEGKAQLACNAKELAKDDTAILHSSTTEPTSGGDKIAAKNAPKEVNMRQIHQLQAEMKLVQEIAVSTQRRLESENKELSRKLENMNEEAGRERHQRAVAEEELDVIKESLLSKKEVEDDLKCNLQALEIQKEALANELKELQQISFSMGTKICDDDATHLVVGKQISTSDDAVTALRAQLSQSYDEAKRMEREREDFIKRISILGEELKQSRYAECAAKEDARKLREAFSSSSSEAELLGQLQATRYAFEEHKRSSKVIENEKDSMGARLAILEKEIEDLIEEANESSRREELRKKQMIESSALTTRQDEKIKALLTKIQEMAFEKSVIDEELRKVKVASSVSESNRSNDNADLSAQIDALLSEKREEEAKRREELRQAEEIIADFKNELKYAHKKARVEATKREEEAEVSRAAALEMKSQLDLARGQVKVANDAKNLAENRLRATLNISASTSIKPAASLLQQQIEQLKAEKNLIEEKAAAKVKYVEDKHQEMLEKFQQETNEAKVKQSEARGESVKDFTSRTSRGDSSMGEKALKCEVEMLRRENQTKSAMLEDLRKQLQEVHEHRNSALADDIEPGAKTSSPYPDKQVKSLTNHINLLKSRLSQADQSEDLSIAIAPMGSTTDLSELQSRMCETLNQLQTLKTASRKFQKEHTNTLEEAMVPRQRLGEGMSYGAAKSQGGIGSSTENIVAFRSANQELSTELSKSKRHLIEVQENALFIMKKYEALRLDKEKGDHMIRQSQMKIKELEQSTFATKDKYEAILSQYKKEAMAVEDQLQRRVRETDHSHAERVSLLEEETQQAVKITSELRKEIETSANELAKVKSRETSTQEMAAKLERQLREEIERGEEEKTKLKKQSVTLEEENRYFRERLHSLEKKRTNLSKCVEEIQAINFNLESKSKEDDVLKAKLQRENTWLKSSLRQCDVAMEAMRNEVSELKTTTSSAMLRVENKKESSEKRLKQQIKKLEIDLNSAKTDAVAALSRKSSSEEALRDAVGELEEQLHQSSIRLQNANADIQIANERLQAMLEENSRLKKENAQLSILSPQRMVGEVKHSHGENVIEKELEKERALRIKAEEIALVLAERAALNISESKLVHFNTDDRDQLLQNYHGYDQALLIQELDKLRPIVRHLQSLYDMKGRTVKKLESHLATAQEELSKYRNETFRQQQLDGPS